MDYNKSWKYVHFVLKLLFSKSTVEDVCKKKIHFFFLKLSWQEELIIILGQVKK